MQRSLYAALGGLFLFALAGLLGIIPLPAAAFCCGACLLILIFPRL